MTSAPLDLRWPAKVRVSAAFFIAGAVAGTALYFSNLAYVSTAAPSHGKPASAAAELSPLPCPSGTGAPDSGQHETPFASLSVADGYPVYSAAYSPDGTWLAVASEKVDWLADPPVTTGGSLTLWDVACATVAAKDHVTTINDPNSDGSSQVVFSPDGKYLAVADGNHSTYVWDMSGRNPILATQLHDPRDTDLAAIAFGPDDTLITSDIYGGVYQWNIPAGTPIASFITAQPTDIGLYSIAVSPNGRTLAVGYSSGVIRLWNIATDTPITTLPAPANTGVTALAFGGRDDKILASGNLDGSTYLWNLTSDSLTSTLPSGASQQVQAVAFNPAGTVLAVATAALGRTSPGRSYGHVYLWNAASHTSLGTMQYRGEPPIYSLAFNPDGATLATGDYGATAYLWNAGWLAGH